jgi:hypothetical protein
MKNYIIFALALVTAMLSMSVPSAQAQEDTTALAIIRYCSSQHPDKGRPYSDCVAGKRMRAAELERDALARELEASRRELYDLKMEVEDGRSLDEDVIAELGRLTILVESLQAQIAAAPSEPAVQTPPQQASPQQPTGTVYVSTGTPYHVLPSYSMMSIHMIDERDVARISRLDYRKSHDRCGGRSGDMLLITNHGEPMSVTAPPGMPVGFLDVFVDVGDGNPRRYKVLDPAMQDDVYITWREGDDIRFVYLQQGSSIQVPGLPTQTVWRYPSSGIKGCDLDDLSRRSALTRKTDAERPDARALYDTGWPNR